LGTLLIPFEYFSSFKGELLLIIAALLYLTRPK